MNEKRSLFANQLDQSHPSTAHRSTFDLSISRQVDFMTMALIDSAFDKEESVRKSVSNALFELGKKQCELVLR